MQDLSPCEDGGRTAAEKAGDKAMGLLIPECRRERRICVFGRRFGESGINLSEKINNCFVFSVL